MLLPGSNSKRARAFDELTEGDSTTSSSEPGGVSIVVSTPEKVGIADDSVDEVLPLMAELGVLMFDRWWMRCIVTSLGFNLSKLKVANQAQS